MKRKFKTTYHFVVILAAGISSSYWAIGTTYIFMPLFWLMFLAIWVVTINLSEFNKFVKRFLQIGSMLLAVSLFQIIFRRTGVVVLSFEGYPLIYSNGLLEAGLLWIRYMILFLLAYLFAQVPIFNFFIFLNKVRVPMQFSLLLLTTLNFLPFIFQELKSGLWTLRFRGFDLKALTAKEKYYVIKKLLKLMLLRGIHYVSYSSLALELRGYGVTTFAQIPYSYPLKKRDCLLIILMLLANVAGFFYVLY